MELKFFKIFILAFWIVQSHAQSLIEKVPIKLVDDLIFMEISVNDHEAPLNFLFDTGAGVTAVHADLAAQLSLTIEIQSNKKYENIRLNLASDT
jgi:hypothetical protein